MPDVDFDDLIPQRAATTAATADVSFDDLIPKPSLPQQTAATTPSQPRVQPQQPPGQPPQPTGPFTRALSQIFTEPADHPLGAAGFMRPKATTAQINPQQQPDLQWPKQEPTFRQGAQPPSGVLPGGDEWQRELEDSKKRVGAMEASLKEAKAKVNIHSRESVGNYNKQLASYRTEADKHNKKVEDANKAIDAYARARRGEPLSADAEDALRMQKETEENREHLSPFQELIVRPFEAQAAAVAEHYNSGMATLYKTAGEIGGYVIGGLGEEQAGIFGKDMSVSETGKAVKKSANEAVGKIKRFVDKGVDAYLSQAGHWHQIALEQGANKADELIGEALGGSVPGLAEFMMGPEWAALRGAAEAHKKGDSEIIGAIKGAAQRYVLGKTFEAQSALSQPARSIAMMATFMGQTAADGGDIDDIIKSGAIGVLYGIPGGGNIGLKDILKPLTDSEWYQKATGKEKGDIVEKIVKKSQADDFRKMMREADTPEKKAAAQEAFFKQQMTPEQWESYQKSKEPRQIEQEKPVEAIAPELEASADEGKGEIEPKDTRLPQPNIPEGEEGPIVPIVPPKEPTPPPPITPEGKELDLSGLPDKEEPVTSLRPAVKVGDKIFTGEVGMSHDDIEDKHFIDNGTRGFVNAKDEFVDRKEGAGIAQDEGIPVEDKRGLHSEDLTKAADSVTVAQKGDLLEDSKKNPEKMEENEPNILELDHEKQVDKTISDTSKDHLAFIKGMVGSGQAAGLIKNAETGERVRGHSEYPEWFQNKGYTKKAITNILDKSDKGDKLTLKQKTTLADLIDSSRKDFESTKKVDLAQMLSDKGLVEGDKIKIGSEWYEHQGFDANGDVKLKDGRTYHVDPLGDPIIVPDYPPIIRLDDTMKKEANALRWNDKTIHQMRRETGKTYSEMLTDKFKEDPKTFKSQAPAIFEKLLGENIIQTGGQSGGTEGPITPTAEEPNQRTTGIKNAVTEEERANQGKDPVEVETRRTFGSAFDRGKNLVDSGQLDPRFLAKQLADKPRALNAEESVALIYDRMRLQNEHAGVMEQIEKSIASDNKEAEMELRQRLAKIEDDTNTNDEAARRTGYEQGLGLAARKMMIKEDYSLSRTLQRIKVATGDNEIPAELRTKIEELTKQLQGAIAKSDAYEERIKELEAKRTIQKIDREVDQVRRQRNAKGEGRADLEAKFKVLSNRLKQKYGQLNMMLDPEDIGILSEMARVKVIEGIQDAKEIVSSIYDDLTDTMPDLTERDVRDAISSYGKKFTMSKDEIEVALREARRQMRLISALEDAQAGESPLHSGLQRDPVSDKVRELQKEVRQAMRESGIDSQSTRTPEEQWKTSIDAVKTRLRNQIHDLTQQIETGKKTPKKIGIKYDTEAEALKAERDRLKKALEDIEGKLGLSDEQRIQIATNAVEKSIAEYERRIKEQDLNVKKKPSATPETATLKHLREYRDLLKVVYKEMQNDAKPPIDKEASALKAYKTRTMSRIADMQDMLAAGEYEKSAKKVLKLDSEAMKLKADAERLKEKVDAEVFKQKQANRTKFEKVLDWGVKYRRFIGLLGTRILGKLSAAAIMRQVTTPMEELVGSVIRRVPGIKGIADQAPRHGRGLNVRAEAAAFRQWYEKQTWKDFVDIVKTGKGDLDRLYGKKTDRSPETLALPGQIHSALKIEPKRAEFYRSLQQRTEWAMNHGYDMTDPATISMVTAGAYNDANRAIFMQDNRINTMYRTVISMAEKGGTLGQIGGFALQVIMPFMKVATNIAAEVTDFSVGGVKGLIKLHEFKDKKKIDPEAADYIMRNFKRQGVGMFIYALGLLGIIEAGGFYRRGEKRKEGEPKAGEVKAGGINWPYWMFEAPAWDLLQMGATTKKVMELYEEKDKQGGFWSGNLAGVMGVMERVPFYEEPIRIAEGLRTGESAGKMLTEMGTSMVIPYDLTRIAKGQDKAGDEQIPREQKNLAQVLQGSIPGQRKKLPLDLARMKRMPIDQFARIVRDAPKAMLEDDDDRKAVYKMFSGKLQKFGERHENETQGEYLERKRRSKDTQREYLNLLKSLRD